jgi:hypothetical protein
MLAVVKKVPKKKNGAVVEGEYSNEIATYKPIKSGAGQSAGGNSGAGATSSEEGSPASR